MDTWGSYGKLAGRPKAIVSICWLKPSRASAKQWGQGAAMGLNSIE